MEETLILLIKGKNKKAFNYFYNIYGAALYEIIDKNLKDRIRCEDIFQDVFTKISEDIEQFDPGKSRMFNWMYDIAHDKIRTVNTSFFIHGRM